jgi:outer membrane lipoprotein-sorting protein
MKSISRYRVFLLVVWLITASGLAALPSPCRGGMTPAAAAESRPAPRQLSAGELDRLLSRLEAEFGQIQTLWADFVQEKHLQIFTEVVRAQGRCLFQSPDRVRFEITAPFQSVLIVNAGTVSKYEKVAGVWQPVDSGQQQLILLIMGHITSWIQGRFREKGNLYDISAEQGDVYKIILAPKNEGFRKHLRAIDIILAKGEKGIRQIILREPGQDFTVINFTGEKRNGVIAPEFFDPRRLNAPPPGS